MNEFTRLTDSQVNQGSRRREEAGSDVCAMKTCFHRLTKVKMMNVAEYQCVCFKRLNKLERVLTFKNQQVLSDKFDSKSRNGNWDSLRGFNRLDLVTGPSAGCPN